MSSPRHHRSLALLPFAALVACGEPGAPEGPSPFGSATAADDDEGAATTESTSSGDESDATTGGATTMPAVDEGEEGSTAAASDGSTSGGEAAASSSDGGSTGAGSSSSTGVADTSDDGTVQVDVEQMTVWETGECDDVTVTNISDEPVTWEVELELPGVVYQLWNAEMVEMNGIGTFVGVAFNETIDPGAQAMFGFCVNY